ncbi:MAG: hypothetical protein ABW079_06665 [Sedimenticola sp.]
MKLLTCDRFTYWPNREGGFVRCSSWEEIELSDFFTKFDISQLQPELIAAAFGAGVIIVAVAEATGIAVAAILNHIKR